MPHDTIYYLARRNSRWHLLQQIELPRDWARQGSKALLSWPSIKECRIVFPNTIPRLLRKGQFINPTTLLREHLAQKEI